MWIGAKSRLSRLGGGGCLGIGLLDCGSGVGIVADQGINGLHDVSFFFMRDNRMLPRVASVSGSPTGVGILSFRFGGCGRGRRGTMQED